MSDLLPEKISKHIWISLIIITLIFWGTYEGMLIPFFKANKPFRHSVNYILLISVAAIGYYTLKSMHPRWIFGVWSISYSCIIFGLTLLGIIDMTLGIENLSLREFIGHLRLFFTSPVPFGVLIFLYRYFGKENRLPI